MTASAGAGVLAAGIVVAAAGPAAALPSNCSQSDATTVTCTFGYTGGAQTWTVPAGVTSVAVDAYGAQGGNYNSVGAGGLGGEAKAMLSVNPGDAIEVLVGGQGGSATRNGGGAGFNGGGAGGGGGTGMVGGRQLPAPTGAGGGGASDVRTGACAATLPAPDCGLGARVLVAGGGGGSVEGGGSYTGFGGAGGNPSGGTGDSALGEGGPGGGGSQTGGGTLGAASNGCSDAGAGSAGGSPTQDAGGSGGGGGSSSTDFGGVGGGGGGGGYYGGGGGGGACPATVGGGGGGGSSFGPSGATFTGTNSGNGLVTISYTGTAAATTTTVAAPATGTAGTAIGASAVTATLAGATSGATGTITFTVFGPQSSPPADCTSGGTTVGTATVSGGTTSYSPSAGFTPGSAGTYWWYASYSGDDTNVVSNSGCGAGMTSTVVSNATTTTVSAPATGTTGTVIPAGDIIAKLSGATSDGGGTITFTVFGPQSSPPADCTSGGTTVGTPQNVTGPSNHAPSADFTPAAAGTYWWYASYSGDDANSPSNSGCGAGMTSTVVSKATPSINSTPGNTVVTGATMSDTATLTGGASPTGTITFTLTDPGGKQVDSETVTVSGDGSYSTPAGFKPSAAGTYQWVAAYSGDGSNNPASTNMGDEPQTALYGFGGFLSPLPKTTLQKSGSTIPVKFRLTNAAGQPISPATAAALAAARDVKATLTGPTPGATALCTWNSTNFQCILKTPSGLLTGKANPYQITVYENVGGGFVQAPAVGTATNPETIYFK